MSDWADSDGWIVAKGGPAIPVGEVTVLEVLDDSAMLFEPATPAVVTWTTLVSDATSPDGWVTGGCPTTHSLFSPKREPSPDAKPGVAGLMRVRDI